MRTRVTSSFNNLGGISFVSAALILGSFIVLPVLPSLRSGYTTTFLAYYFIAGVAYVVSVFRQGRDQIPLKLIWGFAILFRLVLLFTTPTLSDDVYRYAWDGHLLNQGVNPFALPVNDSALNAYEIPLREMVNHNWMASPYLPVAQLLFAFVTRIAPQSILAFQIASTVFDLLTGWLVVGLLKRFRLDPSRVLLYLWNPLVIVEFAHGAHVDSLMIFLMMASLWVLGRWGWDSFHRSAVERDRFALYASVILLAAATLTKPLPLLLAPMFIWHWRWRGALLYAGSILAVLTLFAAGAGWGLFGELDGTGVFGATRIYFQYWNYNSGIYHWLEVLLSGYQTLGAVPVEAVGETPLLLAKLITTGLLGAAVLGTSWLAWHSHGDQLRILRLAAIPLGAYILLTPTLHPWYLTLIIPLLPFLKYLYEEKFKIGDQSKMPATAGLPTEPKSVRNAVRVIPQLFIWPWIYFSIAVAFSYLTYYDPVNLREYSQVRLLEYIPTYALLLWALVQIAWGAWKSKNLDNQSGSRKDA